MSDDPRFKGATPETLARALLRPVKPRKPPNPLQASPSMQWEMTLIHHEVRDSVIDQRAIDGYVNATAMCKVAGKPWGNYWRTTQTQEFVQALSADLHIRISELIQSVKGGNPAFQGTWVHPQVAIHLAQWLSPEFAVKVSQWVFEWFSGGGPRRSMLPDHVRRYLVNRRKIPNTHFSMLNQMTLQLLAPLEDKGYILPGRLMPDIALGKMFSQWCRANGYEPKTFPAYRHEFIGGPRPVVDARLYPNELITDFNVELEKWMRDGRALKYFRERDGHSIVPVQEVVAALPPPDGSNS